MEEGKRIDDETSGILADGRADEGRGCTRTDISTPKIRQGNFRPEAIPSQEGPSRKLFSPRATLEVGTSHRRKGEDELGRCDDHVDS